MMLMARVLMILAFAWLAALGQGAALGADPPVNTADLPAVASDVAPVTADPIIARDDPTVATAPPKADPAQPVKEVTIDPTAKPPVCRRYVPTGSRIATERCQSAEVTDAARTTERDQTRRDIDEMRMRQAARDQARSAAQAEALRQRAGF
jgi:hypothetical protein